MRFAKRPGAFAIGLVGLLLALFPVISVWRVSGQVLDELPAIAATSNDDRHRFALGDPEFILATRSYRDIAADTVVTALISNGFESIDGRDGPWLSKRCCGDYDAVWVQITEGDSGNAVATVTVADADFQASWPIFALAGGVLLLAGFGLSLGRQSVTTIVSPSPDGRSHSAAR